VTVEQTTWEIPPDWKWLTVEEITGVKRNKDNLVIGHASATDGKLTTIGGNIPFILSGDLEDTKEIEVKRWTTEEALDDNKISPRSRLAADRLLMALSWEGTAGKVGIFKGEGMHSHSIIAIIPQPEIVYLDYLFYCFREKRINAYATGEVTGEIKRTSLRKGLVEQVKIPVPPDIDEQRRIVERIETLLRDVQTGRVHLTIMKKDADGILDKALAEIFADGRRKQWSAGPLQKYMHIVAHQSKPLLPQYGSYGSIEFDSIQERTGQLAQIPSFQERARSGGKSKYILEEDQDYLLFVKPSPEKRRIAVLHRKKAVCNTSIQPLSIKASYQNDLLLDFLKWELLALSLSNPKRDPLTCEVSIPSSTDEQQHIITYLEDIRNQVIRIQDNLKKSEAQFDEIEQGILRDALSGKLFRGKNSS
jgi:Type I restriction modification DNA specificity domain